MVRMRVEATSIGFLALLGVEAKPAVFSNLKNIPDEAFKDIPSLAQKDRQSRSRLTETLKAAARPTISRALEDEYDNAQYASYWNKNMQVEDFGFNIQKYSLKYTGCHAMTGFDENIANEENYDTVLGTEYFVTFRLCPTDTCEGGSGYSFGCTSNYGEYMIELDQYAEALTNYRNEKKVAFCQYCEICASMKGYKAWNNKEQGSIQALVAQAQAQFEQWLENYAYDQQYTNSYSSSSNNNNKNGQNIYDENFLAKAKIVYWKQAKNAGNSNSGSSSGNNMYGTYGYSSSNSGSSSSSSQYSELEQLFGGSSKYWNYQKDSDYYQNDYQQSADWKNVNNEFFTYCGRQVLNGYFNADGDFVEIWGYFSKNGNYISFEDGAPVQWDENCHGTMPNGWQYVNGQDPAGFEECDYQYSQTCSSNYLECQVTLYYDDMEALYEQVKATKQQNKYSNKNQNANNGDDSTNSLYGSNQKVSSFESAFEKQEAEQVYTRALTCQQVDYATDDDELEENTYTNQLNYEQLYEEKQAYQQAMADCDNYDDYDTCMEELQAKIDANLAYQQWIIGSAWDEYARIRAMNKQYYIGATCTDSYNIGLKVFSDENCVVPHPTATVSDLLGNIELGYDLVSHDCIPCLDNQFQVDGKYAQNGDDNVDDDNVDSPDILEFCSMLYQVAAKCNQNLQPDDIYQGEGFYQDGVFYASTYSLMYGSEQQQANEHRICSMIESLNSGTYREDGSIFLGNMGWVAGAKFRNEFASATAGMPPYMKNLVFLLAVVSAALGLWAMVLHGALARKTDEWQDSEPVNFSRQESGIVMGRSRSGPVNPGASPLI
ncbi:hypothetical protein ACA910_017212 [Epithemia clementina (nom. ined.)]